MAEEGQKDLQPDRRIASGVPCRRKGNRAGQNSTSEIARRQSIGVWVHASGGAKTGRRSFEISRQSTRLVLG